MAPTTSPSTGSFTIQTERLAHAGSGGVGNFLYAADGYPSGTLSSYTIDNTGTIQGSFSNGQTIPIAQIALATFSNQQGLLRNGSNEFLPSLSSGAANIGAPDTAGRGTITGGSLELSNADIATEFSQLILAERGYEANAKAITTFDQVTQDAINLKQ